MSNITFTHTLYLQEVSLWEVWCGNLHDLSFIRERQTEKGTGFRTQVARQSSDR